MTEYVWLIGGSLMSIPMAKEIKRRGYKLLLTDKNEHCACREYADEFYPISVYDEEKSLELAKLWKLSKVVDPEPFQREIAAVLCIGCDAGPTVGLVSDYLGLPSVGYKAAKRAKNKWEVRKALGLDHPDFGLIAKTSIVTSKPLKQWDYPIIVKPTTESGSKGFGIISDYDELLKVVFDDNSDEILVEELLIGQDVIPEWRDKYGFDTSEIAIDCFVEDDHVYIVNSALRLFWRDMPGIEAGHINPGPINSEIHDLAKLASKRLGVSWGVLKLDLKRDKRYGWCILEAATRLSGGYDHMYTCPLATGKDVTGAMLDVALGKRLDFSMDGPLAEKRLDYACAFAPKFVPGRIDGWSGNPTAEIIFRLQEQEIQPLINNQARPLFIITKGKTEVAALQKALQAAKLLKPSYVS